MRYLIYLCILLHISLVPSPKAEADAPCSPYDDCLFGFGKEFLLAQQVSEVAQEAFNKHWQIVMDNENLVISERERVRYSSCTKAQDLFFAPPDSPLGKVIRSHWSILDVASGSKRNRQYVFESDVHPIRQLAMESKPTGFGMSIKGAENKTAALELLKEQERWSKAQSPNDLNKAKIQYVEDFKRSCDHSKEKEIVEFRDRILEAHKELARFRKKLNEIQQDCQGYHELLDRAERRYSKNETASSRFETLKQVALGACSPFDAIEEFFYVNAGSCGAYIRDVYDIVSPECESRGEEANLKGNLCNGLHNHIVNLFIENPAYDNYLRIFIEKMKTAKAQSQKVDLLQLAIESAQGDPVVGVRLLTLVGHDETNTSMRTIRERLISSRQFKRLAQTEDIYTNERHVFEEEDKRYSDSPARSGSMTLFKDHIRFGSTIGGHKVTGRYYHFVAGVALSCELRARGYGRSSSELAPRVAGDIYETYDFYGHINAGAGFRESLDNYRRDTLKHIKGGKVGSSVCD